MERCSGSAPSAVTDFPPSSVKAIFTGWLGSNQASMFPLASRAAVPLAVTVMLRSAKLTASFAPLCREVVTMKRFVSGC